MGYSPVFMSDIIALKRRGLLDGCRRAVEIGAQQINDTLTLSADLVVDAFARRQCRGVSRAQPSPRIKAIRSWQLGRR
jgi:hypothetical protein